mgnify:CR=1 FL=1
MMNKKHLIGEGFKHVFLMTLSLLCVFPFYWMIVGMTNSSADITMGKLTFGNKLAENVTNAFNYSNLWRAFGNSLLLAVIVTGIGLLICSIAGYAFVVFPSRGKEILFPCADRIHDGTFCSKDYSNVPYVFQNGTFKQLSGNYSSGNRLSVFDFLL